MAVSGGSVLALRALGLGDLLTAIPALRGLRRAFPRHRLVLAAPRALDGLLPLLPEVDELHPTEDLAGFAWHRRPPEVAVNLHGSGPESVAAVCSTRARRVLTHRHPAFPAVAGPEWPADQHEVRRWCRLLEHCGIDADHEDLRLPEPTGPSPPGSAVLHPGASRGARRWPVERYAEVAKWLTANGHRVVITGTAQERAIARRLAELAGLSPDAVLAGDTDLPQLARLVARAKLVVCGDTGVAHLATAFATPSVVLFGPVAPALWGPPADGPHIALWDGRSGDTFAAEPSPGLLALGPGQVIEAAGELLARIG
ncbi:ADP-heptose:LPS heptosyltransferase [Saccharopolyspora antimicrobica]|uniref:ADP-heptose:LPS heptosyltransferase n=1 Tax=Saccharopolyspora antimicrobica TaxID=455193 RepID=A0A1I5KVZ4_9PSEU|nr:glycosyltransferase family 9 protein [Saccharopolyspora antimicrobica]RKT89103.1 ADP-heptose:LPS heptosyltransferase [Saccharopolyspora antimicrobica]SFO89310.1 ADP-heptose:LPS heptosyltransferase [Saccharopolyspora antimicrobica]